MPLSTSDLIRIKRIDSSTNYVRNGQVVETKNLTSSGLPGCNNGGLLCSSRRTDMNFVGKLKTSRETSRIIDFKASQVADYILVQENPGDPGRSGFGRQLIRNTLCSSNGTCVSTLTPKVIRRL